MEQPAINESSQVQDISKHKINKTVSDISRELNEVLTKAEERVQHCKEQCQSTSNWRTKLEASADDPAQTLQQLHAEVETVKSRKRICGVGDIFQTLLPSIARQLEAAGQGSNDEKVDTLLTELRVRLNRLGEIAAGIIEKFADDERELQDAIAQLTYTPTDPSSPKSRAKQLKGKDMKKNVVAKRFGSFLSRVSSGIDKISSGVNQSVKRTQDAVVAEISKVMKDGKGKKMPSKPPQISPDLLRLVSAGALTHDQALQIMDSQQMSPSRHSMGDDEVQSGPSVSSLLSQMMTKAEQRKYFLETVAGGDVRALVEFRDTLVRVHHTRLEQLFASLSPNERLSADHCPVFTAVRNGHLMAARWLVAANFAGGGGHSNCNPRLEAVYHPLGTTLMHVAAAAGFLHIVKWLHNTHGVSLEVQDTRGATPFLVACSTAVNSVGGEGGDIDGETAAFVLIQMDTKVEHVDSQGRNCLHYAALGGQFNLLRRLWRRTNVSINAEDLSGRSTFQVACMTASATDIEWFCNQLNDRQVASKDNQGHTALDIAELYKNTEACTWLREHVEAFKETAP